MRFGGNQDRWRRDSNAGRIQSGASQTYGRETGCHKARAHVVLVCEGVEYGSEIDRYTQTNHKHTHTQRKPTKQTDLKEDRQTHKHTHRHKKTKW